MQAQEISEDKIEQNEDLAKLRAGVSLAKHRCTTSSSYDRR